MTFNNFIPEPDLKYQTTQNISSVAKHTFNNVFIYKCTCIFLSKSYLFGIATKCSTFCNWFLILMNTKQSLHSIFDMLWNISLENWTCNLYQCQNKKYYINVNLIWIFNKELNFEIKCGKKKMETFNKLVLHVDPQKWVLSP